MFSKLTGAKLGAALAAGAFGFGGIAVAAAAGVLPAGLQDAAHHVVGVVPAAHPDKSAKDVKTTESTKATPVGPDATGPAAFGLCTAWSHAQTSGKAAEKSIAFRNLATAAKAAPGDATKIDNYCTGILTAKATDTAGKPNTTGKPATPGKPATAGQSGVTPGTPPAGRP